MKEVLARFEQYLNRHFDHSSTPIPYRSDLKIFIHSISNNKSPETVTAADVDAFVDQQIASGLSPTIIDVLSLLAAR